MKCRLWPAVWASAHSCNHNLTVLSFRFWYIGQLWPQIGCNWPTKNTSAVTIATLKVTGITHYDYCHWILTSGCIFTIRISVLGPTRKLFLFVSNEQVKYLDFFQQLNDWLCFCATKFQTCKKQTFFWEMQFSGLPIALN